MIPDDKPTGHKKPSEPAKKDERHGRHTFDHVRKDSEVAHPERKKEKAPDKSKK
jgi:hypothetical protein